MKNLGASVRADASHLFLLFIEENLAFVNGELYPPGVPIDISKAPSAAKGILVTSSSKNLALVDFGDSRFAFDR